jgi:hypothetical protein
MSETPTIRQKVESALQYQREYCERVLERLDKETSPDLYNALDIFERLNIPSEDVYISIYQITVNGKDYENSWKLTEEILGLLNTDKVQKMFQPRDDQPAWEWSVGLPNGLGIRVYPAEPDDSCKPSKRFDGYSTWICEKVLK